MKTLKFFVVFTLCSIQLHSQLIIKDPIQIIKPPVIIQPPPIIIIPPIYIPPAPSVVYDAIPLKATTIGFADFNSNDTIDYVRVDSTANGVVFELKYDSIAVYDSIDEYQESSASFMANDTSVVVPEFKALSSSLIGSATPTYTTIKYPVNNYTYEKVYLASMSLTYKYLINHAFVLIEKKDSIPLPGDAISIGDFNNDNLPDILLSGRIYIKNEETGKDGVFNNATIFFNQGNSFIIMWSITEPIEDGKVWDKNGIDDYNQDGLQDVNVGGNIYLNDGLSFINTLEADAEVTEVYNHQGDSVFADFNNDKIIDYHYNDTMYLSVSGDTNNTPQPPTDLDYSISGDTLIFTWLPGSDVETATELLTYNIFVGTIGDGTDLTSPLSNVVNGKRKVFKSGNTGHNTLYKLVLDNVVSTNIYWGVQTIDGCFTGSAFKKAKPFKYSIITSPKDTSVHVMGALEGKVFNGTTTLFDADNDNDLDLLTSGNFLTLDNGGLEGYGGILRIYRNDNIDILIDNPYTRINYDKASGTYMGYANSNVEVLDYNNDGLTDFVISGDLLQQTSSLKPKSNPVLALYTNRGHNKFQETILDAVAYGDIAAGDINNDGYQDFIVCGTKKGTSVTYLYLNYKGKFKVLDVFKGVTNGNVIMADYDNDMDLDVLLNGDNGKNKVLYLYKNLGNNEFRELIELDGLTGGDAIACDLNNDKYIDFVLTGDYFKDRQTFVLRNRAGRDFTILTSKTTGIKAVGENDFDVTYLTRSYPINGRAAVEYGDYNNDGLMDLMISGKAGIRSTYLYKNVGEFKFEIVNYLFDRVEANSIDLGDIDNDGDLDIYIQGYNGTIEKCCVNREQYMNNRNVAADPGQVTGLSAEMQGLQIELNWDDIYDGSIVSSAYSYNLWVGTEPGLPDVVSPMSDIGTGYRRVTKIGNMGYNTSWTLDLNPGKYYWSVQAINGSFKGGAWATIDSFEVSTINAAIEAEPVCLGQPMQFLDVSEASPAVVEWLWEFGDGNVAAEKDPIHVYKKDGNYKIHLTLSNGQDTAEIFQTVTVFPVPDANFIVEPVCKGQYSLMKNLSDTNFVQVVNWTWLFRNDHKKYDRGDVEEEYTVDDWAYLTIESTNGCFDIDSQWVNITEYPQAVIPQEIPNIVKVCSVNGLVEQPVSISVDNNEEGLLYKWLNNNENYGQYEQMMSTKSDGRYSCIVTNPEGNCSDTTKQITVKLIERPGFPQLEVISGDSVVCPEEEVIIEIKNYDKEYNYGLYNNNVWVQPINDRIVPPITSQGSYQVHASIGNECGIFSDFKVIQHKSALPKPHILANDGPDLYYMTCSETKADEYVWYYNGEMVANASKYYFFAGSQLGEYSVKIKDETVECYSSSEPILIPKVLTGLKTLKDDEGFSMFPNPANDFVNIILTNDYFGDVNVQVRDLTGKLIMKSLYSKNQKDLSINLNIDQLLKGYYFVNLQFNNTTISKNLVIK